MEVKDQNSSLIGAGAMVFKLVMTVKPAQTTNMVI